MAALIRAILLLAMMALPGGALAQPLHPGFDPTSPATAYRSFVAESVRIGELYRAYATAPSLARSVGMGRQALRLGLDAFDLSDLPAGERPRLGASASAMLADILLRLPEPGEADFPPPGADPPARWTLPGTGIRIRRIADGPRAGDHVFSADTLARLPDIHAALIDRPPLRDAPVTNWVAAQQAFTGPLLQGLPIAALPDWLRTPVRNTPAWKLIASLLVLLLAAFAIRLCWRFAWHRVQGRTGWRRRLLLLSQPLAAIGLLLAAEAFIISQISPGWWVAAVQEMVAGLLLVAAAAWTAWHLCWLAAEAVIASPSFPDDTYDAHLVRLLARVGSLIAVASILIYGASVFGVPVLGLLAGVSVGGIALALAAQSTLENLVGGIAIFADRAFRVGDAIRFGDAAGTVESIGPRSSRIRMADGSLTTVPNAELARTRITNVSARDRFTFVHRVAAPPRATSAELLRLAARLRERLAALPELAGAPAPPRVVLVPQAGEGLALEVSAALPAGAEARIQEAQQRLLIEVVRTLEEPG